MSNYYNEAGEPLMDGAAMRFEMQLDAEYAEERARMAWDEDFYADYDEDGECDIDYDLDLHDGHAWCWTHDQNADECEGERDTAGLDNFGGEDSWLDGSYEE